MEIIESIKKNYSRRMQFEGQDEEKADHVVIELPPPRKDLDLIIIRGIRGGKGRSEEDSKEVVTKHKIRTGEGEALDLRLGIHNKQVEE